MNATDRKHWAGLTVVITALTTALMALRHDDRDACDVALECALGVSMEWAKELKADMVESKNGGRS